MITFIMEKQKRKQTKEEGRDGDRVAQTVTRADLRIAKQPVCRRGSEAVGDRLLHVADK